MDRYSKIAGSLLIALFGAVAVVDSTTLPPPRSGGGLGPGILPFWVGLAVLLLGLGQLASALRGRGSAGRGAWPEPEDLRRVGYMLGALVLYVLLASRIGFFLSSWLFLAVGMKMLADYRWRTVLAGGLAGSLVATAVFRMWLTLPLPAGPIGL